MKRRYAKIIQAIFCLIHQDSRSFSFINTPRKHTHSNQLNANLGKSSDDATGVKVEGLNRRSFLGGTLQTLTLLGIQSAANARGLVRFPCKDQLLNTYHFMRAGTSLLEEEDVWSTNPLFLTNREAALSQYGEAHVRNACKYMASQGINPTVVRYSLAAASVDSANIVGDELKIGRDRLVPEFNYMDPRAIGAWDFASYNETMEAVWAMDEKEAGPSGKGGRPPPNEDGTPAETLSDQVVRLTNLISVLETLYSGDSVLLIFPDGTGPALLSCLIGGIPLNRVHELNYEPAEVRFNVDYKSVNSLASHPPPQYYNDIISRGQDQLRYLREHPDEKRNIKDLKYEEEAKVEAENKKKADAKATKEAEKQLKKKEVEVTKEYNSSFSGEVGIGAAAIIAGGIGIVSSISSPSDETNITQIIGVEDVQSSYNQTQQAVATIDEKELSSADDLSEDVESAMEEAAISKIFADEMFDVSIETKENVSKVDESTGNNTQTEFDYEDGWLGTITDILNEDEIVQDER